MPTRSKCRASYLPMIPAACILLSALATRAHGDEVVVQNDSVIDGANAVICPCFIQGESAAAWLTSPCNGNIVAVQVYWRSFFGGELPMLEESISIFGAGPFPSPGDLLINQGSMPAVLEGPVMTDGVNNEFRFLDEFQTIPIIIPVTAGQEFVVSLEFFNDSPPLGPSVVSDSDGCQAGKNTVFVIPGGWMDACLLDVTGDWFIRAVVDCSALTGACCLSTGACLDGLTDSQCAGAGGDHQGDGSDCASVQCPEATQACCFLPSGCLNLTAGDCDVAGGFPQGGGTNCATVECFPIGACCLPDGSCIDDLPPDECSTDGGTYQGSGTSCALADCPQPAGACCLPNGGCLELIEADCAVIPDSAWAGALTDCQDADANGTADACEGPCAESQQDADHDCDVDLADYAEFVNCVTGPGGQAEQACLCFDQDADGDVDLLDYRGFQNAFTGDGGGCP